MARALAVGAALIVAVAAPPVDAQARVKRIGYLSSGPAPAGGYSPLEPFSRALARMGYAPGRNVLFVERYASGDDAVLAAHAATLAKQRVDVIVAVGDQAIVAAAKATRDIPIVMTISTDPIGIGVVASLAHPGGNVTGTTSVAPDLGRKRLELLRKFVPGASRIAVLWNAGNQGKANELRALEEAARAMSIRVRPVAIRSAADLDDALASIAKERPDALFTLREPLVVALREPIIAFAARLRLPDIHGGSEFADAGGLVGYGPSHEATFERAAVYVDRILRGARPASLPVEQPTTFDLVVNLRTAKSLGLAVPKAVLVQATRAIE